MERRKPFNIKKLFLNSLRPTSSVKMNEKASDRLLCNPVLRHHSRKAEIKAMKEKNHQKGLKAFRPVAGVPTLHRSKTAVFHETSDVDRCSFQAICWAFDCKCHVTNHQSRPISILSAKSKRTSKTSFNKDQPQVKQSLSKTWR